MSPTRGHQLERSKERVAQRRTDSPRQESPEPQAFSMVLPVDTIDRVVTDLAHLVRGAGLDVALRVGRMVVEGIYGGDIEAVRKRGPKDASFRKLAAHPRLPISPVTLWRSVAIYELVQRLPGFATPKHIGVAHIRAVLGLPPALQEKLLRAAEVERWTKERIEEYAAKHRDRAEVRPGRRPTLPVLRCLRQLDRLASKEMPSLKQMDGATLDNARRQSVQESLTRIRCWCEALESALSAAAPNAGSEQSRHAAQQKTNTRPGNC